ncbi:MAG: hypothetical protein KAI61_01980 [Alphaproteobacteria bacterium]|nr:hypothetical protein [Alphaproteobacteria bacterium]MCK5555017.1 hypothetical protein [Alphaproteobacteria bacterium]MCK5658731.1 hypothetical protein [Alphaproteobacteria bacterium]
MNNLIQNLRTGVRQLLAQAIEAEVSAHLEAYEQDHLSDGRKAVVRMDENQRL